MTDGLTIESFRYIWPLLVLIVTLGLVPLAAIVDKDNAGRRGLLVVALIGLAVAALSALRLFPVIGTLSGSSQPPSGAWLSDYLFFDPLYLFAIIFLSIFLGGVLLLSASLWRKGVWEWPVFLCMLLGSMIGMILLASARHLLFLVIALEMASLGPWACWTARKWSIASSNRRWSKCS